MIEKKVFVLKVKRRIERIVILIRSIEKCRKSEWEKCQNVKKIKMKQELIKRKKSEEFICK